MLRDELGELSERTKSGARRVRRIRLLSVFALLLILGVLPFGLLEIANSSGLHFGRSFLCGPRFAGVASGSPLTVRVTADSITCIDSNPKYDRQQHLPLTFFRSQDTIGTGMGYRVRSWHGWLWIEDLGARATPDGGWEEVGSS